MKIRPDGTARYTLRSAGIGDTVECESPASASLCTVMTLCLGFGDKCAIFVMPNDEQQEMKTLDRGSVVRSDLILASVYDSRRSEIGTW